MIDAGTAIEVVKGGYKLLKLHRWLEERTTKKFEAARDEMFREWVAEVALALKQLTAKLAADDEAERRIEALSGSKDFLRVVENYGHEATGEATDDRRRMLAWAAAASAVSSLTIAQLARVERTVRELDPADLVVLRRIAATEERKARQDIWGATQPSGHFLAGSGCLWVQDMTFPKGNPKDRNPAPLLVAVKITMTDLGRWVLALTDGYEPNQREPSRS